MGIITVKLSQLRLSPLNQRRVKPSAVESMADDIAAHGLLQNLVAYEAQSARSCDFGHVEEQRLNMAIYQARSCPPIS